MLGGRARESLARRCAAYVERPPNGPVGIVLAGARRYLEDGLAERAPAMAYYGILSLFPMLLIGVALIRFVAGDGAADDLARYARDEGASGALTATLRSAVRTAQAADTTTAVTAGLVGFVTLMYGASRAFTASGRALDVVAHRGSTARSLTRRAQDLGWTLVVLLMVLAVLVVTALSGHVVAALGKLIGLDNRGVWRIVRWPALVLLGLLIVAVVRWAAPTGTRPSFRLLSVGTVVSVLVLLVETVVFDFYVSAIATYNDTYGAFAGGIVLILWLWLASSAFLFGAELDAVLDERRRTAGSARG
jgi:membrane protein